MNNLVNTFKRLVGNKNTVTLMGVVAGVIVLWFFYNQRVKEATSPTKVPYAINAIAATEQILDSNIGMVEVNSRFLNTASVVRNKQELVGKYVTTGTSIPAGGLFYSDQVVEKKDLPNTDFDNIPDGYTIFVLAVNNHTTYGNSIYPGDRIDLYLKAQDETGKVMFGKFIESFEVLNVKTSAGKPVFNTNPPGAPAELLFAVPDDMYELLMKSQYVSGITIVPVPRNKNYTEEAGEVKTFDYLKDFILAKTAEIPTE